MNSQQLQGHVYIAGYCIIVCIVYPAFGNANAEYGTSQVSCPGKVREWHLSLSLYKLKASVTCSITELST